MGEAQASLSRRSFLKTAGAAGALAAAGGMAASSDWLAPASAGAAVEERVAYTFHQDHCGGMCSLKCTVRDGRMVLIEPNKSTNHAFERICLKGISEIQHVYSDHRVQTPMKRVGERGENKFVSVSWDEALDDIAKTLMKIQEQYGPGAVMAGNASESGTAGQFLSKVIGAQGKGRTGIDNGIGNGLDLAYGFGGGYSKSTGEIRDWVNSRYVLNVGCNILETSLPQASAFFDAKDAGCRIVTVDPHFCTTAAKSHEWIPIQPGTDAALFLGMISVLLDEDLVDKEFATKYTTLPFLVDKTTKHLVSAELAEGEEPPATPAYLVIDDATGEPIPYTECEQARLSGSTQANGADVCTVYDMLVETQKPYTLGWAAAKTDIPAETIARLAREYAHGPACLSLGYGGNDKMTNADIVGHAAAVLVALTGNIGKRGAHVGIFTSGDYTGKTVSLGSWTLPDWAKEAKNEAPIYRTREQATSVRALVSAGDLLVQSLGNMNKSIDWVNKLDFVVFIEPYFTEGCKWADYVLPVTTRFELIDEFGNLRNGYCQVVAQQKVIDPLFEAKPDLWVQKQIADRMGRTGALPNNTIEYIEKLIANSKPEYVKNITLDKLREQRCIIPIEDSDTPRMEFLNRQFSTSTKKVEIYYDFLVDFDQQLPKWEECSEIGADNPLRRKFPLQMANMRSRYSVHNQFHDAAWIQQIVKPSAELNPIDLQAAGIADGEIAELYNDRGSMKIAVVANEAVRPGSVRVIEGATADYVVEGNMQSLTNDTMIARGEKLANGPVVPFCDTLVAIRKA